MQLLIKWQSLLTFFDLELKWIMYSAIQFCSSGLTEPGCLTSCCVTWCMQNATELTEVRTDSELKELEVGDPITSMDSDPAITSVQESRAAARKQRDAASVLFCWSSPTTFTTSIRLAKLRKRPRFRAPNMLTHIQRITVLYSTSR